MLKYYATSLPSTRRLAFLKQVVFHSFDGNVHFLRFEITPLENPCTFLLAKEKAWKRTFNINSELSQNRREKQIMPLKATVNWLFNDMWCHLVIDFFEWKIGFFNKQ